MPSAVLENRLPWWRSGRESSHQGRRHKRHRFDPWIRKIPQRRKWQHTPIFLPGESQGQRNLADYSPWGRKELDMTEWLGTAQHRLHQNMNWPFPDIQAGFRKGRGTRHQTANNHWSIEKAREFKKKIYTSASLTMLKSLTMWITTNCGKFLKR